MQPNNVVDDDHRDDIVDQIIRNCLDQDNPRSFFLFAGAGSGKTKSLIDALNFFLDKSGAGYLLGNWEGAGGGIFIHSDGVFGVEFYSNGSYRQLYSFSPLG